jgi:hypothetical protein
MTVTTTANLLDPLAYTRGWQEVQKPGNPGAGNGFAIKPAGGEVWRLRGLNGQLVTSSAVAARTVYLEFQDGDGITGLHLPASATVAASTTTQFSFVAGGLSSYVGGDGSLVVAMPQLLIPGGYIVKVGVGSMDAGDQLENFHVWTDRFLTGPRDFETGRTAQFPALVDP